VFDEEVVIADVPCFFKSEPRSYTSSAGRWGRVFGLDLLLRGLRRVDQVEVESWVVEVLVGIAIVLVCADKTRNYSTKRW
jgi:hypothetical protein